MTDIGFIMKSSLRLNAYLHGLFHTIEQTQAISSANLFLSSRVTLAFSEVSSSCRQWNMKHVFVSEVACVLAIVPGSARVKVAGRWGVTPCQHWMQCDEHRILKVWNWIPYILPIYFVVIFFFDKLNVYKSFPLTNFCIYFTRTNLCL